LGTPYSRGVFRIRFLGLSPLFGNFFNLLGFFKKKKLKNPSSKNFWIRHCPTPIKGNNENKSEILRKNLSIIIITSQ